MHVFGSAEEAVEKGFQGASVCLGSFDGVHLGHQALIHAACREPPGLVFTFAPHPAKILLGDAAPPLITTVERQLELFARAGASGTILQPFTLEFAHSPAQQFEATLFDVLNAKRAVVGNNFRYGNARAGTVATLQLAAAKRGAEVIVVPQVSVDNIPVSSTRIREAILAGQVTDATRMLGRPFDVDGLVVKGQSRGRALGFPTANLATKAELLPPYGIYAVKALVNGRGWFSGAASRGVNPTFSEQGSSFEVHLLDFDGNLYGQMVRVAFVAWLRAERRFESVGPLVEQMRLDVEMARKLCAVVTTD